MNLGVGEVLSRAGQIPWRHRVLWIFGILAACSQSSTYFNNDFGDIWGRGIAGTSPDLKSQILRWFDVVAGGSFGFMIVPGVIFLLIWLGMYWVSAYGKIGLILGTFQAETGAEKVIFGQLFSEGMPYFWRVFGLSVLIDFPVLIAAGALIAVSFLSFAASIAYDSWIPSSLSLSFLAVLGCFCLILPMRLFAEVFIHQAYNAIVLEDMSILPAICRGWHVFRKNVVRVIVVVILLTVIWFVSRLVFAVPLGMIAAPFSPAFTIWDGKGGIPLILFVLYAAVFIPVSLVLNGVLTSFRDAVWTLIYLRLTRSTSQSQSIIQETAPS